VVALHEHCQVLNHAGDMVLQDRQLNFLGEYTDERFDEFTRFAIHVSQTALQGSQKGGSIVASHAFNRPELKDAYKDRFGESLAKEHVRAVFWKESLRTVNYIRAARVDLGSIFLQNTQLRFLYPVRNPMDCAVSNLKTGHVRHFQGYRKGYGTEWAIGAVLREFSWYLTLKAQWPDRFFHFYEHESSDRWAPALAQFLDVEAQPTWVEAVRHTYRVGKGYRHAPALVSYYARQVGALFAHDSTATDSLMRFADPE
jgi:hypothetical protein